MNITFPKITVVTPVYNGARFIEQTILSVLGQNYPELEYIIIDGGSTDGTQDIIEKYRNKISFFHSEKDHGLYDALNKGFSRSTGEIMCYLNADDLHHSRCLITVAEIFNTFKEVKWITGNPTGFDEQGICREIYPQRKWSRYQYLSGDYFTIQQESVFWRRDLWLIAGSKMNDRLKLAGDFDLWLRFFRTGEKLYSTRSLLGGFRRHSGIQLSDSSEKYSSEIKKIYSELIFTTEEQKALKKINRIKSILTLPIIRGRFKAAQKLNEIYDFPKEIVFDFKSGKYILR